MAANQRDDARLDKLAVILRISDQAISLLRLAVKAAVWITLIISTADTVQTLAGQSTTIGLNFFVELWSALDLSCRWAWIVALGAVVYGVLQGNLRRRKTAYLQGRIRQLEMERDKGRSSSGLTTRGDTPKGG